MASVHPVGDVVGRSVRVPLAAGEALYAAGFYGHRLSGWRKRNVRLRPRRPAAATAAAAAASAAAAATTATTQPRDAVDGGMPFDPMLEYYYDAAGRRCYGTAAGSCAPAQPPPARQMQDLYLLTLAEALHAVLHGKLHVARRRLLLRSGVGDSGGGRRGGVVGGGGNGGDGGDSSGGDGGNSGNGAMISYGSNAPPPVSLSLRQMIRIARRSAAHGMKELGSVVEMALMLPFLPPFERQRVSAVLTHVGLVNANNIKDHSNNNSNSSISNSNNNRGSSGSSGSSDSSDGSGNSGGNSGGSGGGAQQQAASDDVFTGVAGVVIVPPNDSGANGPPVLRIGDTVASAPRPLTPSLVPLTHFVDIPQHTVVLEAMLKDLLLGDNLLLMGNQGVGKNKLVDRLLMLWRRERE